MNSARRGWRWSLGFALYAVYGAVQAEAWYQIEVIALRYAAQEPGSWAAAAALPDFAAATRLLRDDSAGEPSAPAAYRQLAAHELKLAGAYRALARSGNLQPLFHVGWQQPAGDNRAIYLASAPDNPAPADGGGTPPARLEGTVRVNLGTDVLRLDSSFIVHEADTPVPVVESRRMKVDELHYLDHPLVGLLIQVTALAAPATDDTGSPSDPASHDAAVLPD